MSPWPPILHSHPRRERRRQRPAQYLRSRRLPRPAARGDRRDSGWTQRARRGAYRWRQEPALPDLCAGPVWLRPGRFTPVSTQDCELRASTCGGNAIAGVRLHSADRLEVRDGILRPSCLHRIFAKYGRPFSNLGTRQIGDCGQMASRRLSDLLTLAITVSRTLLDDLGVGGRACSHHDGSRAAISVSVASTWLRTTLLQMSPWIGHRYVTTSTPSPV